MRLKISALRIGTRATVALLVGATALVLAGCPTQEQLKTMPGLGDVTPLSPAGRKCYDYCAQSQAACKHMCPKGATGEPYDCVDDCVTESKICLEDCPDLKRPIPPRD